MSIVDQNQPPEGLDSTPIDQGIASTNNQGTELGENEENVSNNTAVKSASPFGATAPKQDEELIREEPVIDGFIYTGLTIMVFNTAMTSATSISPGLEIFALTGQHVYTGTLLFNKFNTSQGGIRFLVDGGRWGKIFSNQPVDACEVLTIDIVPFIGEPMSGGSDPATFIGNQAQNNPNFKMIFFDNLLGNLPVWEKSKTKSALQHDFLALHNAGVNNHIALVAIMDINIPDQKTFLKDLKKVDFCPRMFRVTGTLGAVPTVNVSAKGFSLDLHLDKGKWVEASVALTESEKEVIAVLKKRTAGAKKSDIMNESDLLPSELDSVIKSLKDKGKIVSIRKGTYTATTNA